MRKVVYGCAMSLDGFIAGPNGEYDWIVMNTEIDFAALMARFDTFLIGGRRRGDPENGQTPRRRLRESRTSSFRGRSGPLIARRRS